MPRKTQPSASRLPNNPMAGHNSAMDVLGVILQASYRIHEGKPVVYLYGRLECGATFLVRDYREVPHFYIREADLGAAGEDQALIMQAGSRTTFAGDPVVRVDVAVPSGAPGVRDQLHARGIQTFEADVRFAVRYLIDRGIKSSCRIVGKPRRGNHSRSGGIELVFDDPEVSAAHANIEPKVLSFDIETDSQAERLLAISVHGVGVDEVLVVDPGGRAMPAFARGFSTERAVLEAFCGLVRKFDPDVLTGWNVVDFDLSVLARIAERVHHPFHLGREPGNLRIRAAQGYFGSGQASIPGRLVLDGVDLLRGAFVRMDEYSLDAVAKVVLGEGKTLSGGDRADVIMQRYLHDLPEFARYARTDARLALEIVEKLDVVRLAFERSKLTGMTPDRVAASIASFDFLYLSALAERGLVAPSVRTDDARVRVAQAGGAVFEPTTGIHERVMVFDFKSLYPSIIRTFNVDPVEFVTGSGAEESLRLVTGAAFRRTAGILPAMLDDLFPKREAAKAEGDAVASQAIKILMNSFYGVLGTPACRFYNPDIANAITGQGRYLLHWSKDWFEARGFQVLYGDTDSLFVRSHAGSELAALAAAEKLVVEANAALTRHVAERWGVSSRLELEFEKLYTKLFLPSMRHGEAGARKRYAGVVSGAEENAVQFVGMEVVRRDWTELAKVVQRELYARLFAGEKVGAYLAAVVGRLRGGELDELLVYRKGLRKSLDSYVANTPPHVAAARKSGAPVGRVITYLITVAGPEPLDALQHEPDREHYVDKQIRPVAEPVLSALGLEFARVIGDDKQMGLF